MWSDKLNRPEDKVSTSKLGTGFESKIVVNGYKNHKDWQVKSTC